jgi:hypothetical protein
MALYGGLGTGKNKKGNVQDARIGLIYDNRSLLQSEKYATTSEPCSSASRAAN